MKESPIAGEVAVSMPWEIVQLPFRSTTRAYKRYPDGVTAVATPEECKVWEAVAELRRQLEEARKPTPAVEKAEPPVAPAPTRRRRSAPAQ